MAHIGKEERLGLVGRFGEFLGLNKRVTRGQQSVPRFGQATRSRSHLGLQAIEALGHLAQFISGFGFDRRDCKRRVGSLQIAFTQRLHGIGEIFERTVSQAVGSDGNLLGRKSDHTGQHQSHHHG